MTEVRFYEADKKMCMEVKGHSNYITNNPHDPVCAACSILAYALLNTLMSATNSLCYEEEETEGYFKVEVDMEKVDDKKAIRHFFYMAYKGYKTLEQNYPDNVNVIESPTEA